MRRRTFYRLLAFLSLGVSGGALLLAIVALALAHVFEAGAAAVCSAVFFIPGLLFLNHWRQLYVRDLALAHAGAVAEAEGVTDGKAMSETLKIPREDAEKILRRAIQEGHVTGEIDATGRFISSSAPRCPVCGKPMPRSASGACPSCGAPLARGE